MKDLITLYLADDHQIVIDGLQLLLSNELGFKVVGTSNSWDVAYEDLLVKKPDIAILDLRMPPGIEGIQLVVKLRKWIDTKIIILSMYNDKRYITDSVNYGASGYLFKNTDKRELINCINKVISGEKYFPVESVSTKLTIGSEIFTPREHEILKLVINGYTTQEIAKNLFLSHYTIETHRKNICRKASTRTVLGLSKFASDNNIEL